MPVVTLQMGVWPKHCVLFVAEHWRHEPVMAPGVPVPWQAGIVGLGQSLSFVQERQM
jgi:hypothetical protein